MTEQAAERIIVISALITAGAYAIRRTHEQTAPGFSAARAGGLGPPLPLGAFVTAWGVTFLGVSIMESMDPTFGASFAMLIGAAVFLGNLQPALTELAATSQQQVDAAAKAKAASMAGTTPSHVSSLTPNPPAGVTLH